jgi:hypothetical protein
MAYNKVTYGGKTLIDLSGDTVSPNKLLTGVTAHDKAGNEIVGTMEKTSILFRKNFSANTGDFNTKNLGHVRLTLLETNPNKTSNARVRVYGANSLSELSHGANVTELGEFRLKMANNGVNQFIDTDIHYPYIVLYAIYGDTWGQGNVQAEIEVYDDDTIGILTSFRAMSDCKEVESSARTIAFGDCMVTTIHRTKTTSCTGTFWSHAVDLTEYKTLSIDIAMDQAGDGSAGYNNFIGFSRHYPGEYSYSLDGSQEIISPLVPYSVDYDACVALGNEVFERKTITLDISKLKGDYFPKITAGNAGFIIYRMLLNK